MNFDKRSSPTRSGTTSCVFSMRVRVFAGLRGDLRFSESGTAVRLFADGTSGHGVAVSGPADREVNIRRALCSSADVLSFVGFFSLPSDRRASVPGADGARPILCRKAGDGRTKVGTVPVPFRGISADTCFRKVRDDKAASKGASSAKGCMPEAASAVRRAGLRPGGVPSLVRSEDRALWREGKRAACRGRSRNGTEASAQEFISNGCSRSP